MALDPLLRFAQKDTLMTISEDGSNINVLFRLEKFSTPLANAVKEELKQKINKAAILGAQAMQSAVPWRTGQLRDEYIQIDFAKKNQRSLKASVYISNAEHTASWGAEKPTSSGLGKYLDRGIRKSKSGGRVPIYRSRPSAGPLGGGFTGETKDWINKGFDLFLSKWQI